jgi:tRNA wybutosine-synthesizing protein 1
LRRNGKSSFLVSNGLYPEVLEKLNKQKALPTQLYISLNSPNKEEYEKWHNSKLKDAWERFNKSLKIMSRLSTRTVVRLTLVKNLNAKEEFIPGFAKLIKKASPDFVEVKSYMSVGYARKRLGYNRMLSSGEVKEFSKKLLGFLPKSKFLDEHFRSRVVLLGKSRGKMKIKSGKV